MADGNGAERPRKNSGLIETRSHAPRPIAEVIGQRDQLAKRVAVLEEGAGVVSLEKKLDALVTSVSRLTDEVRAQRLGSVAHNDGRQQEKVLDRLTQIAETVTRESRVIRENFETATETFDRHNRTSFDQISTLLSRLLDELKLSQQYTGDGLAHESVERLGAVITLKIDESIAALTATLLTSLPQGPERKQIDGDLTTLIAQVIQQYEHDAPRADIAQDAEGVKGVQIADIQSAIATEFAKIGAAVTGKEGFEDMVRQIAALQKSIHEKSQAETQEVIARIEEVGQGVRSLTLAEEEVTRLCAEVARLVAQVAVLEDNDDAQRVIFSGQIDEASRKLKEADATLESEIAARERAEKRAAIMFTELRTVLQLDERESEEQVLRVLRERALRYASLLEAQRRDKQRVAELEAQRAKEGVLQAQVNGELIQAQRRLEASEAQVIALRDVLTKTRSELGGDFARLSLADVPAAIETLRAENRAAKTEMERAQQLHADVAKELESLQERLQSLIARHEENVVRLGNEHAAALVAGKNKERVHVLDVQRRWNQRRAERDMQRNKELWHNEIARWAVLLEHNIQMYLSPNDSDTAPNKKDAVGRAMFFEELVRTQVTRFGYRQTNLLAACERVRAHIRAAEESLGKGEVFPRALVDSAFTAAEHMFVYIQRNDAGKIASAQAALVDAERETREALHAQQVAEEQSRADAARAAQAEAERKVAEVQAIEVAGHAEEAARQAQVAAAAAAGEQRRREAAEKALLEADQAKREEVDRVRREERTQQLRSVEVRIAKELDEQVVDMQALGKKIILLRACDVEGELLLPDTFFHRHEGETKEQYYKNRYDTYVAAVKAVLALPQVQGDAKKDKREVLENALQFFTSEHEALLGYMKERDELERFLDVGSANAVTS